MTERATTSARPRDGLGLRGAVNDPAVVAVCAYGFLALLGAVTAYFTLFTQFAPYDDEGTVLVSLQAFADGRDLYSEIYSPYGPFYFQLFGGLLALTGLDVTTELSRSTVVVLWVGAAFLFGLVAQRLTGSLPLGLTGMLVAFASLFVLQNEPMHPQGICVLMLAAFAFLLAREPARLRLVGAACGALLAALLLTKANLGGYAIAATALAAVWVWEPLYRLTPLRWLVSAAFLAMPLVITAKDFGTDWVRELALLEVLAMAAVLIAALPLKPDGAGDRNLGRWLAACATGFLAATAAILAAAVLAGSSPADLYDGAVVQGIRVRDVLLMMFPFPDAAIDWGIAAVAAASLTVWLRPMSERATPALWPGLLRALAGLAILFAITRIPPLSLNPAAENPDVVPMLLAWVAVVPPAGAVEGPYKRFVRLLLPALAVALTLQVYPVAGSQMGIAAITFVPVAALCLADALTSLRTWSEARGGNVPRQLGIVVTVIGVAVVANFALDAILRPAANQIAAYRNQQPLALKGAGAMRLPEADVQTYTGLVDLIERHRCTTFAGYPNINSLYLWTGIEPPPPAAPGAWINAVEGEQQQMAVDAMRASPRPCAIISQSRANFWLNGEPPPDLPLVNYLLNDFRPIAEVGDFQFALPKRRG